MNTNNEMLSDTELDRLLAHASSPDMRRGVADGLLQELRGSAVNPVSVTAEVVMFRRRSTAGGWLTWLSLAAALAAGIYIGSLGSVPAFISGGASIAAVDDGDQTDDDFSLIEQDAQS